MPTSESLITEVAERDLQEGLDHARQLIRARFGRSLFEKPVEAAIFGALRTLRLEARLREDVQLLCALAREHNAGKSAEAIASENLERVLRMRELALIARTKDAEFQPLLDRARAFFAARLPDLARMVAIDDAKDYPELVRRAFPQEGDAVSIVNANSAHVHAIVDHFEKHPHVLRIPGAWVPKMGSIAREIVDWQTARVLASVHEIYATTA